MHTDAIHDVLYALHKARPISDDALSNNFERKCKRIANALRWALGLCFVSIMLVAAWPVLPWSVGSGLAATMNWLVGLLYIIGALYVVIDVWPLARDLGRFNVFTYQQRQLIAAHDIQNAATLLRFTLPELILTEKWLGLRMERSRLRLGILLGGSDKAVILAVGAGAWTVWHNLPPAEVSLIDCDHGVSTGLAGARDLPAHQVAARGVAASSGAAGIADRGPKRPDAVSVRRDLLCGSGPTPQWDGEMDLSGWLI